MLRLAAVDGASGVRLFADFTLATREDGRRAAEMVFAAVTASRAAQGRFAQDERMALSRIQLARYDDGSRSIAVTQLPGAHLALASTAEAAAVTSRMLVSSAAEAADAVEVELAEARRRQYAAELLLAGGSGMARSLP
jgi:hypothetical protein